MKVKNQEGWLAIEAMAAVMVMLISVPIFYNLWAFTKAGEEQAIAAGQLKTVAEGFEDYVLDNYTGLIATSTSTTATSTSFATMKAGGYVQPGVTATNMWGQGYVNYVLESQPGTLEIITLTTGGTRNDADFLNQLIPGTAVKIGSKGGYIPSGLVPGQALTTMQGTYNGWKKSFTGTTIPNPGAGHLVHYTTTDDVAAGQDFLYRKAVPGNPQLNQMETDLDMNGNDIDGAGVVNAATVNATGTVNAPTVNASSTVNTATVNATGTVNAGLVKVPSGNNLQVGNSAYYGDGTNSAIRQNGSLYVQHYNGSAASIISGNISSSGSVTAAGSVTATGNVTGTSLVAKNGIIYGVSNNWGMKLLNSGWGANAAPRSAVGSAYVNDMYIRSIGKWASQIGSGSINYGVCHYLSWGGGGGATCPTNYVLIGANYRSSDSGEWNNFLCCKLN